MKAPEDAVLDEFCDALWLEDGLSRNTLDGYRRDLTRFRLWLEPQRGKTLLNAEHSDLLAYLAHRVAGRVKATTTSRQLSSLKRFYRHALRQGKIGTDPSINIDAPRLPRGLPKSLTETDVEKLLAAPDVNQALGLRALAQGKRRMDRANHEIKGFQETHFIMVVQAPVIQDIGLKLE